MSLKKMLAGALVALPLMFSSCSKKPDYISVLPDKSIRIDYEKMSNLKYYSIRDLEKELRDIVSSPQGMVALMFGAKEPKYKEGIAGAWEYAKDERAYICTWGLNTDNFTPLLDPNNKKPEFFVVLKSLNDAYIFADKKWIEDVYPKFNASAKYKFKKIYGGIYQTTYHSDDKWGIIFEEELPETTSAAGNRYRPMGRAVTYHTGTKDVIVH